MLEAITGIARSGNKEAWKILLCRFYQLSTRVKSQMLFNEVAASKHAQKAIALAKELDDLELLAASRAHAACTYHQQYEATASKKSIGDISSIAFIKLKDQSFKSNL